MAGVRCLRQQGRKPFHSMQVLPGLPLLGLWAPWLSLGQCELVGVEAVNRAMVEGRGPVLGGGSPWMRF